MNASVKPQFGTLDRSDAEAILARNHLGRIFHAKDREIGVLLVDYVYSDGWIYGRMPRSRKQDMLGWHNWWPVAFQVDEVEDLFHWRSVVVHGGFYALPPEGSQWEQEAREHAIDLLRQLIPETFRPDDPVPFRNGVFQIAVQEITAHEALPGEAESGVTVNGEPTDPLDRKR